LFRLVELRREPKPEHNEVTGVLHYTKSFIRWDKDTGEYTKLHYNASRWENTTINLDDSRLGIEVIRCSKNWTNITFKTSADLSGLQRKLSFGMLLFASHQWDCSSTPSGIAEPVFRAVNNPTIMNGSDDETTLAVSTTNVPPFVFFGNASVSFYTNHSLLTAEQVRKVMKKAGLGGDSIDLSKSPKQNLVRQTGKFPDTGAHYGYGTSIDIFNWNYNRDEDAAVEDLIQVPMPSRRGRSPPHGVLS
jgi:hypothetical protein